MLRGPRNLFRLLKIALTLARHDAVPGLEFVDPSGVLPWIVRRVRREGLPARPGPRLAQALTELGPSFVKIGQALSTRADFVGEEIAADLSELQDHLAPFPGAAARATVEAELGRPIREIYASFDDEAIAAASIAQVHFATTIEGEAVAVKVLRPGVEAQFARDLDLFFWLAHRAERHVPALRRLKPVEVVGKFAETVAMEMDLRLEAAAAAELGGNFAGDPEFRVPRVDWTRTARRVLTMERIEGIPVDEREALIAAGHDVQEILARAARTFFRQVFRDGFFHGDMHPGNIFVAKDGALVAVDFGITGRIDKRTRIFLAEMLQGFLTGNYAQVASVHFRAGYVPADQSEGAFIQACRAIAEPIMGRPLNEISLARLLAQLFEVTEAFHMETQPQLLLLQKSMLVCEGVGRKLAPEVNMWTMAEPLVTAWMIENRGPAARAREVLDLVVARVDDLPNFFNNLERATAAIAQGVKLNPEALAALGGRSSTWWWMLAALVLGVVLGKIL